MFLTKSGFKKLLTQAYKGSGLYVGRCRHEITPGAGMADCFLLYGSFWALMIREELLPKEAKGTMVTICGAFPDKDELVLAREKELLQTEIWPTNLINHLQVDRDSLKTLRETLLSVKLGDQIAMLQDPGPDRTLYYLKRKYVDMIDRNAIEIDEGEDDPDGPYLDPESGFLYWMNDGGIFMITQLDVRENERAQQLSEALAGIWLP